jgi:hypothetical protein
MSSPHFKSFQAFTPSAARMAVFWFIAPVCSDMLEDHAASILQGPDLGSRRCVSHMNKKSTFEGT